MEGPVEKPTLFLYEIRLNKAETVKDAAISKCDCGKRIVGFMAETFHTKFSTMGKFEGDSVINEVLVSEDGATLLQFRMYDDKNGNLGCPCLLTLTIELLKTPLHVIDINSKCQQFLEKERRRLTCEKDGDNAGNLAPDQELVHYLPPIKRGHRISPYFQTSDDRICHYSNKRVLYDVRSKYQHIQIFDLVDQGATLFLDGMVNLGECDIIGYTHALMDIPKVTESYAGSRILILGGGDGSLLKELIELSKPPKEIIMIDLDDEVMLGCAKFMQSVCGPYLDKENRKGQNYEVICGDAISYMEKAKANGEKYDFIFGDMTDIPVNADGSGENANVWKLFRHILELVVHLVKPNTGKFMTHCTGKSASATLANYEAVLKSLQSKDDPTLRCCFEKTESFVQSFLEVWVFYQVSMMTESC